MLNKRSILEAFDFNDMDNNTDDIMIDDNILYKKSLETYYPECWQLIKNKKYNIEKIGDIVYFYLPNNVPNLMSLNYKLILKKYNLSIKFQFELSSNGNPDVPEDGDFVIDIMIRKFLNVHPINAPAMNYTILSNNDGMKIYIYHSTFNLYSLMVLAFPYDILMKGAKDVSKVPTISVLDFILSQANMEKYTNMPQYILNNIKWKYDEDSCQFTHSAIPNKAIYYSSYNPAIFTDDNTYIWEKVMSFVVYSSNTLSLNHNPEIKDKIRLVNNQLVIKEPNDPIIFSTLKYKWLEVKLSNMAIVQSDKEFTKKNGLIIVNVDINDYDFNAKMNIQLQYYIRADIDILTTPLLVKRYEKYVKALQ